MKLSEERKLWLAEVRTLKSYIAKLEADKSILRRRLETKNGRLIDERIAELERLLAEGQCAGCEYKKESKRLKEELYIHKTIVDEVRDILSQFEESDDEANKSNS